MKKIRPISKYRLVCTLSPYLGDLNEIYEPNRTVMIKVGQTECTEIIFVPLTKITFHFFLVTTWVKYKKENREVNSEKENTIGLVETMAQKAPKL